MRRSLAIVLSLIVVFPAASNASANTLPEAGLLKAEALSPAPSVGWTTRRQWLLAFLGLGIRPRSAGAEPRSVQKLVEALESPVSATRAEARAALIQDPDRQAVINALAQYWYLPPTIHSRQTRTPKQVVAILAQRDWVMAKRMASSFLRESPRSREALQGIIEWLGLSRNSSDSPAIANAWDRALQMAGIWIKEGTGPELIEPGAPYHGDLEWTTTATSALILLQDQFRLWDKVTFRRELMAVLEIAEIQQTGDTASYEMKISRNLLRWADTPAKLFFIAAHESAHRWNYGQPGLRAAGITSLSEKAIDKLGADLAAIALLRRLAFTSSKVREVLKDPYLCASCAGPGASPENERPSERIGVLLDGPAYDWSAAFERYRSWIRSHAADQNRSSADCLTYVLGAGPTALVGAVAGGTAALPRVDPQGDWEKQLAQSRPAWGRLRFSKLQISEPLGAPQDPSLLLSPKSLGFLLPGWDPELSLELITEIAHLYLAIQVNAQDGTAFAMKLELTADLSSRQAILENGRIRWSFFSVKADNVPRDQASAVWMARLLDWLSDRGFSELRIRDVLSISAKFWEDLGAVSNPEKGTTIDLTSRRLASAA